MNHPIRREMLKKVEDDCIEISEKRNEKTLDTVTEGVQDVAKVIVAEYVMPEFLPCKHAFSAVVVTLVAVLVIRKAYRHG